MRDDLVVRGREEIADWIETTSLARTQPSWSVDAIATVAEEELGLGVAQVQQGLLAMERRQATIGVDYPFDVTNLAVRVLNPPQGGAYTSLLLLTPGAPGRQLVHKTSTSFMETAFESVVQLAMGNLWGPASESLRFGWPSEEGRPQEFDLAVTWLAKRMGVKQGTGYRPPRRKDGGVDVVAWRPFPDAKSGIPIVLVQCTLQADIINKAADVDARLWASWLTLDVDPMTALAVPQVVPSGVAWDEITLRAMLLDRARLAVLVGKAHIGGELEAWCAGTLRSLSTRLQGAER